MLNIEEIEQSIDWDCTLISTPALTIRALLSELKSLRAENARLREALLPFADAWEIATAHERTKHLSLAQLADLAAGELAGVHFQRAASVLGERG